MNWYGLFIRNIYKTVFDVQSFRISGNMYNFVKFQLIITNVCLKFKLYTFKIKVLCKKSTMH